MPKITEQWLLFKYVGGEFTALSKLKTKERAEKERLKYPEKERKAIGIGVIRRVVSQWPFCRKLSRPKSEAGSCGFRF